MSKCSTLFYDGGTRISSLARGQFNILKYGSTRYHVPLAVMQRDCLTYVRFSGSKTWDTLGESSWKKEKEEAGKGRGKAGDKPQHNPMGSWEAWTVPRFPHREIHVSACRLLSGCSMTPFPWPHPCDVGKRAPSEVLECHFHESGCYRMSSVFPNFTCWNLNP